MPSAFPLLEFQVIAHLARPVRRVGLPQRLALRLGNGLHALSRRSLVQMHLPIVYPCGQGPSARLCKAFGPACP
eukprot:12728970-Alexandrium_andersonii.AAC.1